MPIIFTCLSTSTSTSLGPSFVYMYVTVIFHTRMKNELALECETNSFKAEHSSHLKRPYESWAINRSQEESMAHHSWADWLRRNCIVIFPMSEARTNPPTDLCHPLAGRRLGGGMLPAGMGGLRLTLASEIKHAAYNGSVMSVMSIKTSITFFSEHDLCHFANLLS